MRTFHVSQSERVLVVEDSLYRIDWFKKRLPMAQYADNPADAVGMIRAATPQVLFLDFDLANGTTSRKVAELLAGTHPCPHIVIHSANYFAARRIKEHLLPWATVCEFGSFEIVSDVLALLSVPENGNDVDERIVWEFWKIPQSAYRYREPGVIDLGDIDRV